MLGRKTNLFRGRSEFEKLHFEELIVKNTIFRSTLADLEVCSSERGVRAQKHMQNEILDVKKIAELTENEPLQIPPWHPRPGESAKSSRELKLLSSLRNQFAQSSCCGAMPQIEALVWTIRRPATCLGCSCVCSVVSVSLGHRLRLRWRYVFIPWGSLRVSIWAGVESKWDVGCQNLKLKQFRCRNTCVVKCWMNLVFWMR